MRERARIAAYLAPLTRGESGSFALSDDAAIITPPQGMQLVITTDSVIEAVHVPKGATAAQMATKLVRRNLSDIAAMGAIPWRYTLNIHTSATVTDAWFKELAHCLHQEQERYGMILIGGDTTSGEGAMHLTMTVFGLIDRAPLRREGAQEHDLLYVSGTIGDGALGLALIHGEITASPHGSDYLRTRYEAPEPRLALGAALRDIAHAAIDCSDGLIADASQLAAASQCGMTLYADAVPLSPYTASLLQTTPALLSRILTGGDDYELIFAAPKTAATSLEAIAQSLRLPLTVIGECTQHPGIRVVDKTGAALSLETGGYEH